MEKRIITSETENIEMYRNYGITEWREKSIVLGVYAALVQKILELDDSTNNELVEMVRLPFPEFARRYFSGYEEIKKYVSDPAFGYKLYLMSYSDLALFSDRVQLCEPDSNTEYSKANGNKNKTHKFNEIMNKLQKSLDEYIKIYRSRSLGDNDYKFAYIAQYIDTDEAHKLGLPIATLFDADEESKGFNIESKLDLLNPVARITIARTLGLYGYDRIPANKIASILKLSPYRILYFVNTLMPLMIRPIKEMICKIGYTKPENPDAMIEYKEVEYRNKDIIAECLYYLENVATPAEAAYLSSLSNRELQLYIASKHFGWTTEQVCRNLVATPRDIERIGTKKKK